MPKKGKALLKAEKEIDRLKNLRSKALSRERLRSKLRKEVIEEMNIKGN